MTEIGGIQKTTLIDYPGKVAATVFLIGCNFRCPFCYSSEIVLPEKIKNHPRIEEEKFFDFLEDRKGLLEGIVVCGGEPTFYPGLPAFISRIKKMGFLVKLDTNGSNPEMLEKLISEKLIDYIAMDIKAPLTDASYEKATGVKPNLDKIKKSIEKIKNSGIDYEFRTTIVPGVHTKEEIIQMAKDISPAKKYYLQDFLAEKTINPNFESLRSYPREFLEEVKEEISHLFDICEVRG